MGGWVGGWTSGWVGGWVDGQVDGWTGGWVSLLSGFHFTLRSLRLDSWAPSQTGHPEQSPLGDQGWAGVEPEAEHT